MKKKIKIIILTMVLILIGNMGIRSKAMGANSDEGEFAEFENYYESKAPTIDTAELSSTFTSDKEIEVYLKTTRNDIKNIVISGWSGGAYSKYKTSKTAIYDSLRDIYIVNFNLDEIVNTNTNEKENVEINTYYFDACVYGTNGAMSYYNLDNVEYTATGFTCETQRSGDSVALKIKAEEAGKVEVIKGEEKVVESNNWKKMENGGVKIPTL